MTPITQMRTSITYSFSMSSVSSGVRFQKHGSAVASPSQNDVLWNRVSRSREGEAPAEPRRRAIDHGSERALRILSPCHRCHPGFDSRRGSAGASPSQCPRRLFDFNFRGSHDADGFLTAGPFRQFAARGLPAMMAQFAGRWQLAGDIAGEPGAAPGRSPRAR